MAIRKKEHEHHEYSSSLVWTGARAGGTTSYQSYSRDYEVWCGEKPPILSSADPCFRGSAARYNPEELLVASLSGCHMLSYLADCARAGVVVVAYADDAHGIMGMRDGKVCFTDVVLRPRVAVAKGTDVAEALALHETAHAGCYIASSVNFPVRHEPTITIAD
jgi:organic hydroperoxide reductase OsmC/OhrA